MLTLPAKCSATYTIACSSALYAVCTFPGRALAKFNWLNLPSQTPKAALRRGRSLGKTADPSV
eukprot:7827701-Heterocapsa_arctica.AAC.1